MVFYSTRSFALKGRMYRNLGGNTTELELLRRENSMLRIEVSGLQMLVRELRKLLKQAIKYLETRHG